jgi:hypothetical protein
MRGRDDTVRPPFQVAQQIRLAPGNGIDAGRLIEETQQFRPVDERAEAFLFHAAGSGARSLDDCA